MDKDELIVLAGILNTYDEEFQKIMTEEDYDIIRSLVNKIKY